MELVHCSCKKTCRSCKCRRNELRCTQLCACNGQCFGETTFEHDHQLLTEEDCGQKVDLFGQEIEEDTEADYVIDLLFEDID